MRVSVTGIRIAVFLSLTFCATFAYELLLLPRLMEKAEPVMVTALFSLVMLIPAICVLLTRLITKEGFRDSWIRPLRKGSLRYFLLAWFAPSLMIITGAALYFLVFPADFDSEYGYLRESIAALGQVSSAKSMRLYLLGQTAIAVLVSPLLNIIFCFGEEWGWRGYLLPRFLEKISIIPTLLISGLIWGLWHAPLIVMGHNYGIDYLGYPFAGIAAMCIFCICLGVFFSYLTLKTRSMLPAAIAHGSLNGLASISLLLMSAQPEYNPFIGPLPTGIIGGSAIIVAAIWLMVKLHRDEKAGKLIPVALQSSSQSSAQASAAAGED